MPSAQSEQASAVKGTNHFFNVNVVIINNSSLGHPLLKVDNMPDELKEIIRASAQSSDRQFVGITAGCSNFYQTHKIFAEKVP